MARLLMLCLILTLTQSCFLKKSKKNGGDEGSSLVKKETIFLDRIGDGDAARLKFKTKSKVFCRLEVYSQEKGMTPSSDKPRLVACAKADEAKDDFVEKIDDLRTDTLYYVRILLLKSAEAEKHLDRITVKESGNASSSQDKDGKYKEIFMARLNQPLRSAEFHRHEFKEATAASAIRAQINRKTGCSEDIPAGAGPFSAAAADFKLGNLATTNYASGKAIKHGDKPGVKRLSYKALNTGIDRWSFLYDKDGKDYEVKALPGNVIETVELKSRETMTFGDPKLTDEDAPEPLPVSTGEPLVLSWETDRKLSTATPSYIILQIGQSGEGESIYCIFDAKTGRGEVPERLLSKMGGGTYDVLVELETSQIWAKDGWLVTAYDWRAAEVRF